MPWWLRNPMRSRAQRPVSAAGAGTRPKPHLTGFRASWDRFGPAPCDPYQAALGRSALLTLMTFVCYGDHMIATATPQTSAISLRQAAAVLGVSEPTARRLAHAGALPAYRVGRRIVVDGTELAAVVRDAKSFGGATAVSRRVGWGSPVDHNNRKERT